MSTEAENAPGAGEQAGMEEKHRELCREMFARISEYLNGELSGVS